MWNAQHSKSEKTIEHYTNDKQGKNLKTEGNFY